MRMRAKNRYKLSTTVAPETRDYLTALVKRGMAGSLAEAVDIAVHRARRAENRARLEGDTAAYFAALSSKAARVEKQLGEFLGEMADEVDLEA